MAMVIPDVDANQSEDREEKWEKYKETKRNELEASRDDTTHRRAQGQA
jgi:hypothetical protein